MARLNTSVWRGARYLATFVIASLAGCQDDDDKCPPPESGAYPLRAADLIGMGQAQYRFGIESASRYSQRELCPPTSPPAGTSCTDDTPHFCWYPAVSCMQRLSTGWASELLEVI